MFEIVLRVVLGVVLAGAALAKLASPRLSIAALSSYGFPEGHLRPIAWAWVFHVVVATEPSVFDSALNNIVRRLQDRGQIHFPS